jgi:hypothetical protein
VIRRGSWAQQAGGVPTFLVAGVPKAGTSSLWMYLRAHPEIYMPRAKELHYLTRTPLLESCAGPGDKEALRGICRSFEEYRAHYIPRHGETAMGDASPSTFYFTECIPEVKRVLGDPQVVVILRHPVGRAFSNYCHLVREGREQLSFIAGLHAEKTRREAGWSDFWRYCDHSLYADRLAHYQRVFGRDRVTVVLYDDLASDPRAVVRVVYAAVGVAPEFIPPHLGRAYNSRARRSKQFLRWPRGRGDPHLPEGPDQAAEELVQEKVDSDIARLEQLLSRNLDQWRLPVRRGSLGA